MDVLVAEPDFTFDVEDLRELHRLLAVPAVRLRDDLIIQLELPDSAEVDTSFELNLQEALTGTVGSALGFTELIWRLGCAIANLDPNELAEHGTIELQELAPQHETRLEILEAEVSSFLSKLKTKSSPLANVAAALSILCSASHLTGINLPSAGEGARADGTACVVQLAGRVEGSAAKLIEEQLPGLPSDCTIKMNIETADGAHLTITVRGAGLS